MKIINNLALSAVLATATLASAGLSAQTTMDMSGVQEQQQGMDMNGMKDLKNMGMGMSSGEVKKIDREARKITLKHGEIKSMEMPPMTMIFRVQDAAMLDHVKVGDKVKFSVARRAGAMVISALEITQ